MKIYLVSWLLKIIIFVILFYQKPIEGFSQQNNYNPTERLLILSENLKKESYTEIRKIYDEFQESINQGAEVNSINSNGVSPLNNAFLFLKNAKHDMATANENLPEDIRKQYIAALKHLIDSNSTELKIDGKQVTKEGALKLLAAFETPDILPELAKKIVDLLIENGGDIDFPNKDGQTILQSAILMGDYELCKQLMPYKPNVNLIDKDGLSMLQKAIEDSDDELCELLLSNGSDANILSERGTSLLQQTIDDKDYKLTKLLLTHGANANLLDNDGVSLLQKSIENNDYSLSSLLLRNGADINIVNEKIQQVEVSKELKSLLVKNGATFKIKKSK